MDPAEPSNNGKDPDSSDPPPDSPDPHGTDSSGEIGPSKSRSNGRESSGGRDGSETRGVSEISDEVSGTDRGTTEAQPDRKTTETERVSAGYEATPQHGTPGNDVFDAIPGRNEIRAGAGETDARVVLCPHISLEYYRGGEKWVVALANRLVEEGINVAVRALPYLPDGQSRVDVEEVLDERVSYREAWRHDVSGFDSAYVFYTPFSNLFFTGDTFSIAGIHSWVYVTDRLYERHYGAVPTAVKLLYRLFGERDLQRFDVVHTVTPAFDSPHPRTVHVPNFVDTGQFSPDRAPLGEEFTVLVTAAHILEKGWDLAREVASRLPEDAQLVATGTSDDPNVKDLGFLDEDELAEAYASAHVVLHPARVDTDSMVINEACASGTPVVTTPLATHVRENEAVLHAETPGEMVGAIRLLHREWERNRGYASRCRLARSEGKKHSVERIYPRLEQLLVAPEAVAR